ncbi:hypothetical protein QF028_001512 [Neobacillus sp. B4I6]|uniref:hypothetical protein n=1 Tax=Neobacillus sp. B4I6 TaxID=3373925 RepID=UPI003D238C8A
MVTNLPYTVEDVKNLYNKYIPPKKRTTMGGKALHQRFMNYIVSVCKALDFPFETKGEDVLFDAKSYKIMEFFHINQAKHIKGEIELISSRELYQMLGVSVANFNVSNQNYTRNEKTRENWLNLIKMIRPKVYMKSVFWFSKEEVAEFKNSLGNVYLTNKDIQRELLDKHNVDWTIRKVKNHIPEIKGKKVIDFIGNTLYYHLDIVEELVEKQKHESELYLNCEDAGKLLGFEGNTMRKYAKEKNLFPGTHIKYGEINKFTTYILKEDVEKWQEFRAKTVPLIEIVANVMEELGLDIVKEKVSSNYVAIKRFVDIEETDFEPIDTETTPFRTYGWLVKLHKIQEAKEYIKLKLNYLVDFHQGKQGSGAKYKFISYVEKNKGHVVPNTINNFYDYTLKRFNIKRRPSFQVVKTIYDLFLTLEKELMKHNDEEINVLIDILYSNKTSKRTIEEFCRFLNDIKKKYKTTYKKDYLFNANINNNKHNNKDKFVKYYTEEQFFNFGLLLLNDTHEWYEDYLEKACTRRASASVWLYCLIHFICGWRSKDVLNNVPFPLLPIDESTNKEMAPDIYISLAREGKITENMASQIVKDVKMKVDFLYPKPTKTEKHNPPGLVWEVPTSIVPRLGMLLGLCESHRRKNKKANSRLITTSARTVLEQEKFFGSVLSQIGESGVFSSSAANITYLSLIAKKGDQIKMGSGYIIASIARSHKFARGKVSNITSVYLQYFGKLTESDILFRELFERGVLSFVPYLLLKTIIGEDNVKHLPPTNQTSLMEEIIPYSDSPYDLDNWVQTYDDTFTKARKDVEGIINYYTVNGERDIRAIHFFIDRIACGTAPAKEKNLNCIAVAKGIGCIHLQRKTCIGCGQEIYLKHTMYLLGQKLRERIKRVEDSKTLAEQMKHEKIYEQVYEPILDDIKQTLLEVYGFKSWEVNKYLDFTDEPENPHCKR